MDDVLPDVKHMVWNTRVDLQGIVLLTLVSLYYYYSHKWRIAWRLIGNVARIILELGLSRRIVLDRSFPDEKAHTQALNTMWAVFVLEQQLRHALGIPSSLQDFFLDSTLPKPVDAPYLEAMIRYARIGAQAREAMSYDGPAAQMVSQNFQDAYTYFQYRISEWQKDIKTQFQFKFAGERADGWNRQLDTILRLRANNLNIVVARFILFGNGIRGMTPAELWSVCVDKAADTSCILATIDGSPEAFRATKSESNYFLVSSIGMSLLAMSQSSLFPKSTQSPLDPATCLRAQQCAMLCLNLLRNRAELSRQSRHLWGRVNDLASRLNLLGFLVPVNPGSAADGVGPVETEAGSVEETWERFVVNSQDQVLESISPSMMDPTCGAGVQEAAAVGKIYSPFDLMFDSDYNLPELNE